MLTITSKSYTPADLDSIPESPDNNLPCTSADLTSISKAPEKRVQAASTTQESVSNVLELNNVLDKTGSFVFNNCQNITINVNVNK